jgi:tetratricopeptide (TPR) repeat protein
MSGKFRTQIDESLTTVEKHNTPLAEAPPPSLDALKAYSTGLKVTSSTGEEAAVPFFKRAAEIDPQFAVAYAYIGLMYGAMSEAALSVKNTSKAYELRDRASDAEKFFITASYDSRVTGNFEKAQQTCDVRGEAYLAAHRGAEAAAEFQKDSRSSRNCSQRPSRRAGAPGIRQGPTRSREIKPGPGAPIRIFLLCGKTPTPKSRS